MMYFIFWMFFGVGLAYWLGYQSARSSSDQKIKDRNNDRDNG